jgi:hypothetical protein
MPKDPAIKNSEPPLSGRFFVHRRLFATSRGVYNSMEWVD